MICYRGMAFCSDSGLRCGNTSCDRVYTHSEKVAAERWWGNPSPPVQYQSYWDQCLIKQPITTDHFDFTKGNDDDD